MSHLVQQTLTQILGSPLTTNNARQFKSILDQEPIEATFYALDQYFKTRLESPQALEICFFRLVHSSSVATTAAHCWTFGVNLSEFRSILSDCETRPSDYRAQVLLGICVLVNFPSNSEFSSLISSSLEKASSFPSDSSLWPLLTHLQTLASLKSISDELDSFDNMSDIHIGSILQNLGYRSCTSPEVVKAIFSSSGIDTNNASTTLSEIEVAKTLAMMAHTPSGRGDDSQLLSLASQHSIPLDDRRPSTWEVSNFLSAVKELRPITNWHAVLRGLDHEEFSAPTREGWDLIVQGFGSVLRLPEEFPTTALCERWKNVRAQVGLLKLVVGTDTLGRSVGRRVVSDADITCPRVSLLLASSWNNLDVVEALLDSSKSPGVEGEARDLLESFTSQYPELAVVAFTRLVGHPGASVFTPRLPDLLQKALETDTITRNFTLQQLWMFSPIFVVSQVLARARRGNLSPATPGKGEQVNVAMSALESLPQGNFQLSSLDVVERGLATSSADCMTRNQGTDLIVKLLAALQKRITTRNDTVAMERLNQLAQALVQAFPNLQTNQPAQEEVEVISFPPDVEEEANSYYERLYGGILSVPQVIEMLRQFRSSNKDREEQVYQCMIHNLFDEYKYFSGYPDDALNVTGVLFGSLIQNQLVAPKPMGFALRCVIEALGETPGSKVFKFGLQSLNQFKPRLPEMPQFCSALIQIPHLEEAIPDVYQIAKVHQTKTGETSPNSPMVQRNSTPRSAQDGPQLFTALKLDTLLESTGEAYEVPPEQIQDKILFIINNLSHSNMDQKVREMKEVLKDEHVRWFCNHIVVKRASIEPNFHSLYVNFLDAINSPLVNRFILLETYANIRVLLNSEKTVSSSSERTLLKNLGTWLGTITLSKNRPIKHNNLAFKELLLEAYDNNRLIVVIPFVCKVLEPCSSSKVFKPPNPWLLAIMRLLSELYHDADLKLNLKFEIEVLCKRLDIDIKDIEPSNVLKERQPEHAVADESAQLAKEFEKISMGSAATGFATGTGFPMALSGQQQPHATLEPSLDDSGTFNIASYIIINASIPAVQQAPLRRIIQAAIERSIREVLAPVVERAVTIATISTRELVIKDFALEPNEEKMRRAAHLMAQSQASSLASVTCKEPLRISLFTNLRAMLAQNGFPEQVMPEPLVTTLVAENLELATSIVEKSAAEKAIPEIDDALSMAYLARKKHREQTPLQPFLDLASYSASRYPSTLPETLRLKPGGLNPSQMRVYEDFARISRFVNVPAVEARVGMPTPPSAQAPPIAPVGTNLVPEDPRIMLPYEQVLEKIGHGITALDRLISQTPNASLTSFPPDGELRKILPQIPILVTRSSNPDETALVLSQKVVQLLYRNDSPLSREVYVVLLQRLCEISKRVTKEVTQWLLYAEDERKYNVALYHAILQSRILNANELDTQLARLMEAGKINVIDFTCRLIRSCLIVDPFGLAPADFASSLELLNRFYLRTQGKGLDSLVELAEDLRKRNLPFGVPPSAVTAAAPGEVAVPTLITPPVSTLDPETAALREQLQQLFTDWVRVYYHPNTSEKSQAAYILQLQQQSLLQSDNNLSLFIRICTEVSVDHYLRQKATPNVPPAVAYQAIDAFSRLIILLVKYHIETPGGGFGTNKIGFVRKVLSLVLLVLVHAYEQRKGAFNQRPFFRLFSSLLYDLHTFQDSLQPIYFAILSSIGNTFHTLQPSFLPGFTFSWLQLVSHRHFMPKLLAIENQRGWPFFQRLLVDLFRFLAPYLRYDSDMKDSVKVLYRGTLRIMLVLLHDFPDFLSAYAFSLTDVIPLSCIQLRNLILSAFPRNMRLPDPFTPNLKIDALPEIAQAPVNMSDYMAALTQPAPSNTMKQEIDTFLKTKNVSFLQELLVKLQTNTTDLAAPSMRYNVPLINALTLYLGVTAIQAQAGKGSLTNNAQMEIFQYLMKEMDAEGRYLLLSAIVNQLRFPNSHTHYFSCILLYLFGEAENQFVQEQITRVLLERLIVNRPHPWGLLITFIELIKNPRYNFWQISNVWRSANRDIESLFESISRIL